MNEFKPSEVRIDWPMPLTGTMKRSENEVAAAMLILACALHDDKWQPVTPKMLSAVIDKAKEEKNELFKAMHNPFVRPDFYSLIEGGFATGEFETPKQLKAGSPMSFTDVAFKAMRKYVPDVKLTHDLVRDGGPWTCVNCGRSGESIREVNKVTCPKQPTDNENVLKAIEGKL